MTLIEMVLAMGVMLLLFSAAFSSLLTVKAMVVAAKNRTRAVAILNQRMEEMRSVTFDTLVTNLTEASYLAGAVTADSSSTDAGLADAYSFQWTRASETTAADVGTSMLKVRVTVQWKTRNRTGSISAFSYFSRYGVMNKTSS